MTQTPRIGLDIGTAAQSTDAEGRPPGERAPADEKAVQQWRERLARDEPAPDASARSSQPAPSPFDLFAQVAAPVESAQAGDAARRTQAIGDMVARMLVSEAASAAGAQVRIRFKDDLLPGTEMTVSIREGALQVELAPDNAESAAWLATAAGALSEEISRRLRRDVRVSVAMQGARGAETIASHEARGDDRAQGPAALFPASAALDDTGGRS